MFFHFSMNSIIQVIQSGSLSVYPSVCLLVSLSVHLSVCLLTIIESIHRLVCLSVWQSCQLGSHPVRHLVSLPICLSVSESVCPSVGLSACPPSCLSTFLSVHLSVSCQSLSQSIGLSVFLSDSPLPAESHPVRQPDGLSICLSVSPSIFLSVHLFFCLYLSSVSLALIHLIKSCLWNIEIYVLFVRSQI